MNIETSISQKSSLRQHLTPQQVRFVRMLEMSGPEVEEAVKNELDENPALETIDRAEENRDDFAGDTTFEESSEQLQAADYANEDEIPSYLLRGSSYSDNGTERNEWFEQHRDGISLIDSLNSQLDMIDASPKDVEIARYIVGNLDDNGRLTRSLRDIAEDISEYTGHEISREDLKPALDIVRYELDPPGLGAVDLRECLLIQLRRRNLTDSSTKIAREIIEHYFDLFTKKHFERLQTALAIDKKTLNEAIAVIRSLDPKPGTSFSDASIDKTAHISPDFFVFKSEGENDRFTVSLNQRIPELGIEESFKVDSGDDKGRLFIRRKREEANSFIDVLKRRSETLLTVMKAIVTLQKDFFRTEDPATLRPMILNDISQLTGLDKSVISRATANKYVATEASSYPLKFFFNDTPTDDRETSSSEIMAALREIIDTENKKHPLSDRALTEELNKKGYGLARRTVTKYREKIQIPVARLRKEY